MREVKIYLRRERVDPVVHALTEAGIGHVVLNHVQSFGRALDPKHWRLSLEAGERCEDNAKIEFVCTEPEVDRLLAIIRAKACTGVPGDGIVFVAPVDRAVKIRTGAEGHEALR